MSKSGGTSVNHQNWRRTKEEFSTLMPQQEGYKSANTIRLPRRSGPRVIQIHISFSGVHPTGVLAQQSGQEPKTLTITHSRIQTDYGRASYGPRRTPSLSSKDLAAPRDGFLLLYEPRSVSVRGSTPHPAITLVRFLLTSSARYLLGNVS